MNAAANVRVYLVHLQAINCQIFLLFFSRSSLLPHPFPAAGGPWRRRFSSLLCQPLLHCFCSVSIRLWGKVASEEGGFRRVPKGPAHSAVCSPSKLLNSEYVIRQSRGLLPCLRGQCERPRWYGKKSSRAQEALL